MVRYGAHPNRERIATTERIAEERIGSEHVHSFTSGDQHVVDADGYQFIFHLLRGKYDIRVNGRIMAKYTSWDEAEQKFTRLLERGDEPPTGPESTTTS